MKDDVRPNDTHNPRMIFALYLATSHTEAACCIPACLLSSSLPVRLYESRKAVKRQITLLVINSLQKAKAVCFQPYPDPMIRHALIIICLLRLGKREQKFYSAPLHNQQVLNELLDNKANAVNY